MGGCMLETIKFAFDKENGNPQIKKFLIKRFVAIGFYFFFTIYFIIAIIKLPDTEVNQSSLRLLMGLFVLYILFSARSHFISLYLFFGLSSKNQKTYMTTLKSYPFFSKHLNKKLSKLEKRSIYGWNPGILPTSSTHEQRSDYGTKMNRKTNSMGDDFIGNMSVATNINKKLVDPLYKKQHKFYHKDLKTSLVLFESLSKRDFESLD